jgi:hypothetical protein
MLRPYKIPSHRAQIRAGRFSTRVPIWLFFLTLLVISMAHSQEVFVDNPGKSLNFFHFDLRIERGFDFPPERLIYYSLVKHVQKELGAQ